MQRVGFIGLGTMGKPMAKNVLKKGFDLVVYDQVAPPVEELAALGAARADSPAAVARATDVVITMLPSSPQVEEVALGERGIIHGARAGQVYIDMSTIDPITTRRVAAALAERGVQMLDAPVSGSSPKAVDGTLTIMVGGPADVVERCRPVFAAMGEHIIHVGDIGMGEVVKLVNTLIAGVTMVAVAEAFNLGVRAGADPKVLYEVVSKSSGNCWTLHTRTPYPGVLPTGPANEDFAPGFMTDLMRKDLGLCVAAARELKAPALLAALAEQLYAATGALGYGRKDFSAVVKTFEALSGK